jgi:hypothetical protein
VTSDKIDLSAGKLELKDSSSFKEYMLLNNLDKQSQFYKLLKNDLQISRKEVSLRLNGESKDSYYMGQPFINSDGVTMVSARYLSRQFGAEVQWNKELKLLTIIDSVTGTPIVLSIGSKVGHVNGVEIPLESPAILKNGSVYVPLRFLTDALGAKLEWDESTHTIHISRD